VVADLLEHLAQLAVAALNENHFVPGVIDRARRTTLAAGLARIKRADIRGRGLHPIGTRLSLGNADTLPESIELFLGRLPAHFDQIRLLNSGRGLGELVRQFAVIRDEQKSLAQIVEPTDGVQALAGLREELHDRRPPFGIADRGHIALRLVEHEVPMTLRSLQQFAIDPDMIAARIGFAAKFRHHRSIHLNAAGRDQLFSMAPARNSGFSEDLL
jgi:hypothetical protein